MFLGLAHIFQGVKLVFQHGKHNFLGFEESFSFRHSINCDAQPSFLLWKYLADKKNVRTFAAVKTINSKYYGE